MVILPPTNEEPVLNTNYIYYWNNVCLDLIRLTHTASILGPQNGPPITARVLGILHLAIHDAYFSIQTSYGYDTYLSPNGEGPYRLPSLMGATDARQAVAAASITVLRNLYTTPDPAVSNAGIKQLSDYITNAMNAFPNLDVMSASYRFGIDVGNAILNLLAIKPGEPGANQGDYRPSRSGQRFGFDDDPTNPVRIVPVDPNNPTGPTKAVKIYNAPFYGMTAKRIAVQHNVNGAPVDHILADPPAGTVNGGEPEYEDAFQDIYRMGGAIPLNTTKRRPEQTTDGFFWAYDGSNLIGVPLRSYNQILRKVAYDRKPNPDVQHEDNNADFARLFALVNAALADAGIFAWQEKYSFEYWRPLSGVRQDTVVGREKGTPLQDPFWLELGAPSTNSADITFKPPFPSYPSGHATFGGAAFQSMRLYYKIRDNLPFDIHGADNIGFDFVSDELNGISRDLRDPFNPTLPITEQRGTVRTFVRRGFQSLWEGIIQNALSRVYLGVHWRFDAFASADTLIPNTHPTAGNEGLYSVAADGTSLYKPAETVRFETTGTRADRGPDERFPIGGVPLGIQIADDIFQGGLRPTPPALQPMGRFKGGVTGEPEAIQKLFVQQ